MAGPGGGPPSVFAAGLACRCPRCGRGRLYRGLLKVAARCTVCGLDLAAREGGDGPAVSVILVLGPAATGAALWVEAAFAPPTWLHMALWPPAVLVLAVAMLRPAKALLLALHHRHFPDGSPGPG